MRRPRFGHVVVFVVAVAMLATSVTLSLGPLPLRPTAPRPAPCSWAPAATAAPRPAPSLRSMEGTNATLRALGDPATSGLPSWPSLFDATPTAFDLDGDGRDELIAQSNDTKVYVFDSTTGRARAALPTNYPPAWYIERVLNRVQAAVLRPGEPPSLVVTDHAACVAVWRLVPGPTPADGFSFEKLWERRMTECFANPGMDAEATLVDLDRDGTLEILVQTEEVGFYALAADGTTRWKQCWAGGNAAPVADDLDGDGDPEAIFASDSGFLSVIAGRTGKPLWTFDARDPRYGIDPASVSVSPTVAELDGRPPREVLFTARHAPSGEPARFPEFHLAIFAVHQNRTTWQSEAFWVRQPSWAHPLSYTRLVVRDVDGNGTPAIFGMDWNTIGHHPGHWEPLGPAHAFRLTPAGEDVWVRPVEAWWSNKDVALGDTDGDGRFELWVNGAREGVDGVWGLDVATGEPGRFLPAGGWTVFRGPALLDLNHDARPEIVLAASPPEAPPPRGAILILEPNPGT